MQTKLSLFVYGTLRSGGRKEALLRGCRLLGPAETPGTLYHLGQYPVLVLDGSRRVIGELWECPAETLLALDAYEGVGEGLFERARLRTGERWSWTYVAGPLLRSALDRAPVIETGDWSDTGMIAG